jgi:hypothetical protein
MNSFLFSRSSFPAKKNKFWWILDRDIKFSARKSGRSRKKESPASFCIESHVFSLLFMKAQIIFRQRQWWDLWNVVSIVHFGCRNPKLLRATTLNACHLVPTTVGGGGGPQSARKKKYNYPECPWSLLVYWRRRRMCASTAAVVAFASAAARAKFCIASASAITSHWNRGVLIPNLIYW